MQRRGRWTRFVALAIHGADSLDNGLMAMGKLPGMPHVCQWPALPNCPINLTHVEPGASKRRVGRLTPSFSFTTASMISSCMPTGHVLHPAVVGGGAVMEAALARECFVPLSWSFIAPVMALES